MTLRLKSSVPSAVADFVSAGIYLCYRPSALLFDAGWNEQVSVFF